MIWLSRGSSFPGNVSLKFEKNVKSSKLYNTEHIKKKVGSMSEDKTKSYWIIVIPIIISTISLIISVKSCSRSDKALDISEKSFLLANRPHIEIIPKKLRHRYIRIGLYWCHQKCIDNDFCFFCG